MVRNECPGAEPFAATGTLGSWSLSLPAGASAQSPPTCVDAAYPTIRFFTQGTGLLEVNVVYGNYAPCRRVSISSSVGGLRLCRC